MKKITGKSGSFKSIRLFFFLVCFQGKALYAHRLLKTSAGSACHSSYLSDFEEELRRLAANVEERFQAGRLNGIYFIKKTDISEEEEPWSPILTPPTREGDTFLNTSYYGKLIELLQPVFRLQRTGVIVVDSLNQMHKLKKAIAQKFPEGEFSIYNNKMLSARQKEALKEKSRKGAFHYIFVTSDNVGDLDLSHTSNYIRLDRIWIGNRIQEIQNFLDSYKGSGIPNLFFLTDYSPAKSGPATAWLRLITTLSQTSVNTELNNNKPARKQMGADQALNYLQSWKFTSGQALSEWYGSFLRSKHFPTSLRLNSRGGLSDSSAVFEQGNENPSSTALLQTGPSLSLPVRAIRRLKFRYTGLSEEEKAQIDWLIEGMTGLTFTEEEKVVLRFRLFTENQVKTTEAVGRDLNKTRFAVQKMEDELLTVFQTSPLIPFELRDRIRFLSKKSDSVFGYGEFSKEEQAQIDRWVAIAKERIKWSKRDLEIMDDCIFTVHPKTRSCLARRFNIHPNSAGSKVKQILTHLRDNPSVPRELRDLIAIRLPYNEKIRFKYSEFSEEEQTQIDGWVALTKERINLTDRELYFMDHYIFTAKREPLKTIGMKFSIDPTAVFYHVGRLLRNLRDNPSVPEGLRELMKGGGQVRERYFRFRYSEFSKEEQAQIDGWVALAQERLTLDKVEKHILERHIFTGTPETLKDIGWRWGINPHDMTVLKNNLLRKLQTSGVVPAELKTILPNPG